MKKIIKAWAVISKNEGLCCYGTGGKFHIYWSEGEAKYNMKNFKRHKVVPVLITLLPPKKMKKIKLKIVKFPAKKVKIKCKIHGIVGVKSAYDPFLKKMTAISCEKCPTINPPKKRK